MIRRKIYLIAAVVSGFLAQSCFVAKDYARPQINSEDLYRTEVVATDSTSLADIPWDSLFTDSVLRNHIATGLKNNHDIRIAIQNISAAQASMKQGRAGYLPSFNLGADWTHQELSKNSQFGALLRDTSVDQFQFTGNLSWEADIWGKIRSNQRASNAAYLQSVAASQAVKTQLISDIASMYFQLMALDAQIRVAEESLINRNESVETIIALKDAGNVTEVGVKQTEAQKYATEIVIADLKNAVANIENALSVLLGTSPGPIERGSLDNQLVDTDIVTGVPAMLLSNRPDVIAAEYNLVTNFELTNVARSNFYPSLRVTATGGFQSIDIKEWFSVNSLFANVVSGLTQPVFNQRQIRTRYEIAKANQEIAYLQFEQALLNAGREVSDAIAAYDTETHKLSIRTRQVEALRTAAGYSDELLSYGLANYLEVLTAKDNALNSELELIGDKYRQLNAVVQLYRALGGGWK